MTTTPFQITISRLMLPIGVDDHRMGRDTAPVSLVEYGDFQCPYCAMAHAILRDVLRLRAGTVQFAFRHFPLTNVHPYAELAAEAAEAAGVRGQFWPVHDWLFDHQRGIRHVAQGLDRHQTRDGRLRLLGRYLPARRALAQPVGDEELCRLGGADARVEQMHAMPRQRRDLRNSRAHRARSDDAHFRARRERPHSRT